MAKKVALMTKDKKRHPSLILTKAVYSELIKRVENGLPLFTEKQWKEKIPSVFIIDGQEVKVFPNTYSSWVKYRTCPEGMTIPLGMLIREAKHRYFLKRHEEDKKELVLKAQRYLKKIQKLPLGTKTVRKYKEKGYNDRDGEFDKEVEEEMRTPINPAMVAQKRASAEFVLKGLDPAYEAKSTNKNLNVMVSLKDLREASEKEKKADYENP